MSIKINSYIEPLSLASEHHAPVIIESDAYQQVWMDLERYVNGEILGRSFLIAGHRGAGKTTMLRQAVQKVESRMREKGEPRLQVRPLFIALHGPDLLKKPAAQTNANEEKKNAGATSAKSDAAKPAAAEASAENSNKPRDEHTKKAKDSAAPPNPPPANELFHFLDRITSGLYFGAAQEFSRCFRRKAEAASNAREKLEFLELAADLQVQLDRVLVILNGGFRLDVAGTRIRATEGQNRVKKTHFSTHRSYEEPRLT